MALSDKIEQIRSRADIVRIIGMHVVLKKSGKRYTGLCPFHSEKGPSFSVSAEKGLFYCFGCHARGDVFSFVEQMQGLDFPGAVRWLAKEVGVDVEPESPAEAQRRKLEEGVAGCNRYALAFFQHALWAKGGEQARHYLKARSIPEEQARERGLGFGGAPGALIQYLIAKKVPEELAQRAGLLNDAGDRNLFDERLIFPIVDQNGRIAGFGGRWLGEVKGADGQQLRPKYVNTKESPLFSKRTLLYGWDVAHPAIRRLKRIIICEGYTDVLACQRAGIEDAVAALGTAFTAEHAQLAKRFANEAIILLDSDAAGERASKEAAEKCVAAGLKTMIAPLPKGDDPDSLVRKNGPEALQVFVSRAKPAVEHFIDVAYADAQQSIEDKARAAQALWPLFKALGQSLERDLYMARLAERVGINTQQLEQRLHAAEKADRKDLPKRQSDARSVVSGNEPPRGARRPVMAPQRPPPPQKPPFDEAELNIIVELLLYPPLRSRFSELARFASAPMQHILKDLAESSEPPSAIFERHGLASRWVKRAAQIAYGLSVGDSQTANLASQGPSEADADYADRLERTFSDVLARQEAHHVREERKVLLAKISEATARGDATDDLELQLKDLTRHARRLKRAGQRSP